MSAVISINTLNEILVFDLSLAIWSIRTNQLRGKDMGTRRRGISRSLLDVSDGVARAGLDCVNATSFVMVVARSASGRPRNVQVSNGRWAQTPARIGFRPAG